MDCSRQASSIHGILQARKPEWAAMPSSRGSFWHRDWTHITYISCIGRRALDHYHHPGSHKAARLTFSSVQFSRSVMSDSLWPHEPQHARPYCPSPTPRVPCPLSRLVMPSNHLLLCCPLLLQPSIFPRIRIFSNESALHIRWPKYWSFSFSMPFQ